MRSVFSDRKSDIVTMVTAYPPSRTFFLADPLAIKTVTHDRFNFQKPLWLCPSLLTTSRLTGPSSHTDLDVDDRHVLVVHRQDGGRVRL